MIPSVRYGPWQPHPSRPSARGLRVRFLTCSSCGAILARQFNSDLDDEPGTWTGFWSTQLRAEMIPLPQPASEGLPRYGQQSALRRGKSPRAVVRLQPVWELRTGPQHSIISHARRPLRPAADDILPGDPPVWFIPGARPPCEVYCHNCGRLHVLKGRGPEDAPLADFDRTRPEAVADP